MSWMAYTDFLSRLRIAAGILLPLNTRTLLLYPGGRDCIGAAGVDTYLTTTTASYNFCVDFWSYISSSYTVYEAAQDAADNGTGRPIEFTGDTDYNGYY